MKKIVLIFIFLIIPFISAVCEEGQIDINSASAIELDKIKWVGESTAQNIINTRPFSSVEDLIKVAYIGDTKLTAIKEQGLACVDDGQIEQVEEVVETIEKEDEKIDDVIEITEVIEVKKTPIKIENDLIDLSPQTIKSENDKESLSNEDYAKYGLGLFCVLLCGLFIIRKNKLRKNEFR